jgi:Subtilase family
MRSSLHARSRAVPRRANTLARIPLDLLWYRTLAVSAMAVCTLTLGDPVAAQDLSAEASARARVHAGRSLGLSPAAIEPGAARLIKLPETKHSLLRYHVVAGDQTLDVDVDLDTGEIVDGASLLGQELALRRTRRGKLSAALRQYLDESSAATVPVTLWLQRAAVDDTSPVRRKASRKTPPLTRAEIASIQSTASQRRARESAPARRRTLTLLGSLGATAHGDEAGPFLHARVPRSQLAALESASDVLDLDLDDEQGSHDLDVVSDTLDYRPDVHENLGLRGGGEILADIEYRTQLADGSFATRIASHPCLDQVDQATTGAIHEHASCVAGVLICSDPLQRGVAPDATLVFRTGIGTEGILEAANQAIDVGARALNFPISDGAHAVRSPTAFDRGLDELFTTHFVTVVKSAGNRGCPSNGGDGHVTHPGLGYNTITVGAFDDRNTAARSDDTMYSCSSWGDPTSTNSDREKPEVAAPGASVRTTNWTNGFTDQWGTSEAAPVVAGIATLMMNANHDMRVWPEVVKAAIMVTARFNVEGAARLSEYDGVGGVSARDAVDLVRANGPSNSDWLATEVSCASFPYTYSFTLPKASRRTRVVVVWPQDPSYIHYESQPNADLGLEIRGPFGSVVASSNSFDNTYEIVDFNPLFAGQYTARITSRRCDSSPGAIGLAWFQEP